MTIEYVAQADEISIDLWYERYYEKGAGITISFFAFLEGKRKLKKARELIVFLRCLNKEETMLLELEYLEKHFKKCIDYEQWENMHKELDMIGGWIELTNRYYARIDNKI